MLPLPNEAVLKVECPVYKVMALVPNTFKMGKLQETIHTETVFYMNTHNVVVLINLYFSNSNSHFSSLRWGHIRSDDSVTTGFPVNL